MPDHKWVEERRDKFNRERVIEWQRLIAEGIVNPDSYRLEAGIINIEDDTTPQFYPSDLIPGGRSSGLAVSSLHYEEHVNTTQPEE